MHDNVSDVISDSGVLRNRPCDLPAAKKNSGLHQ